MTMSESSESIRIGVGHQYNRGTIEVVVEPPLRDTEIDMLVEKGVIPRDRIYSAQSGGIDGTHIDVARPIQVAFMHADRGSVEDASDARLSSQEREKKGRRVAEAIVDILKETRTEEVDYNPRVIQLSAYQKRHFNPLSE